VVTWVVFWIRPPAPARVVILHAGYDRTLAVPPNPYGKHDARELGTLARPGSWLGTRSRLVGGPTTTLTRNGLPDLSALREKCIVVFIAAHGGRDRDGPFLFPEDSTGEPADRVRFKTILDQLARLPANEQKLLIIDATREPAFTDLGLVHNDFAGGVEELDAEIAAVPNLAVFLSSGLDERSWSSPEWGTSAFLHFALMGLNGSADADGNRRVTAGELVAFVTPRVSDWVRDNRGARQVPLLLPKSDGMNRVSAMHLVSVDKPTTTGVPEPFEPPPELAAQWQEYRELAQATPPPTAYTPHLWRQYEAWTLRHEQHILAGDTDGAKIARANAAEVRRKIEAARTLDISPQTLAIQSAIGGQPYKLIVPESFKLGIDSLAREPAASRAKLWAKLRDANGTEADRLLWVRALIEWVAVDPVGRLQIARELIPLVGDGFAIRPAELNFLAMLAQHLPPPDKKDRIGPLLTHVLRNRLNAEQGAALLEQDNIARAAPPDPNAPVPIASYPFAEFLYPWVETDLAQTDSRRREVEDLCFATDEASWNRALGMLDSADAHHTLTFSQVWRLRDLHAAWHREAHQLPALGEWHVRRPGERGKWGARDGGFFLRQMAWYFAHDAGAVSQATPARGFDWLSQRFENRDNAALLSGIDSDYEEDFAALLKSNPEHDATQTPRADSVRWWNAADAVLTAPPPNASFDPAQRVALAREFRRVSRQLLITNETRPEALPEVTPAKAREVAFETASRRAVWLLGRLGGPNLIRVLTEVRPGEDSHKLDERLKWFAFQADGRQSLAAFGSRCGELFDAVTTLAKKPDGALAADRWVRISPAHASVSDEPIDRVRRDRIRDYLAHQARRTFADHWYGEGGSRYYHLAIQRLKDDAVNIGATGAPKDKPFESLLRESSPFPVVPKLPTRISITDEPKPEVRVGFAQNPTQNVEGFAVFWTDTKARTPVSTKSRSPDFARNLTRPPLPQPLTPKAQTEQLPVSGFFRGRTYNASTPIDFYPAPDRAAVVAPLSPAVSLAVRADVRAMKRYGFGTGAVAIVLDCSGSMGRDPKDPMSVGLYPAAVAALEKLLVELPPGTTVTVWTFGQKTFGVRAAEETIRELLPPTALPLTAEVYDDLLSRTRGQEPWHESPVIRAAVAAKNRIKNEKVPFKAVVLLSDAVDNRFAVDSEYGEKKRTIGDVLRAEFPPEVAFGVVAFPVGKEEQAVQGEFRLVEKLMPAGKFVPPEKIQHLIDWLRTGLNPRVRFKLESLTSDSPPLGGLMAGTAEADNWYVGKLAPGQYRLSVLGNTQFASDIALSPGDRLLLDLTENNGELSLKRHWFADSVPAVAKAGDPEGAWRLALLQNWSQSGKLELFATIDGNPIIVNRLTPTKIGEAWFEVTPQIPNPDPVAMRWRAESGFPATCWSFGSPGWPQFPGSAAPASPRLAAWWSAEPFPTAPEQFKPLPNSNFLGLRSHSLIVAGSAIVVDSITLEEHEVEVSPEERQKRLCLVVRIAHANAAPVFARPLGVAPTGREMRVYKAANKTTSIFWWPGLDADSVKAKVLGFEFVRLNDALRAAEKAGRHLTLPAPAPTDTSAKPKPPTKY
jgi:hypothetical protein